MGMESWAVYYLPDLSDFLMKIEPVLNFWLRCSELQFWTLPLTHLGPQKTACHVM